MTRADDRRLPGIGPIPVAFVIVVWLLAGCGSREGVRPAMRQGPDPAPWLSDGRVGVRILDGGTRMRIFRSDRYQPGGEEKIVAEEAPLFPASAGGWGGWSTIWPEGTVVGSQKGDRTVEFRLREGTLVAKMTQPDADPNYVAWPILPPENTKLKTTEAIFATPLADRPSIVIDGSPEDQARVDLLLGQVLASVAPWDPSRGSMGVAPMTLSSDIYHGHVFWDADIWVFPALALIDPDRAAVIPRYRLQRLAAARQNAREWLAAGRPDAVRKSRPKVDGDPGLKFPWESSVSGKETTPGFSKWEDHITGSVAFSLRQASWLGIVPTEQSREVIDGAGRFYRLRADGRSIKNVVSVDESHTGSDCLYTNLLAGWSVNGGRWREPMPFVLPRDRETFLTYANDPLRGYKQAAAVLSVFPLQYAPAEREAGKLLARFEEKATRNGPAMTGAIHATIRARLGDRGAIGTWRDAIDPYVKAPGLFSEKRGSDRTAFVTGAAGALNTVLYGFVGLRLDDRPLPGSAFPPVRLKDGGWLSCRPNLPAEWRSVTIDRFTVLGRRYRLTVREGSATLRPLEEGGSRRLEGGG